MVPLYVCCAKLGPNGKPENPDIQKMFPKLGTYKNIRVILFNSFNRILLFFRMMSIFDFKNKNPLTNEMKCQA